MEKLTKDVYWLNCNDYDIDIFEGIYAVKGIGMAYNSYLVKDEKIAVMDSVDAVVGENWLKQIDEACSGRVPNYLVVQHMEPDHSQHIRTFMDKYPNAEILASHQAFTMMKNFYGDDYPDRRRVIGEGDVLNLGRHQLHFIAAPMVHWPEVIMTYDSTDKILFSADGFGKFGASDIKDDWVTEARRYYTGIVGKYGIQVQSVLKKAASLDINMICPLHGWVLQDSLDKYIRYYEKWSTYEPEEEGVGIYYASVYGRTEAAALYLAEECKKIGTKNIIVYNLMRSDSTAAVASTFRIKNLVLCSMTYNMDVSPYMGSFLEGLVLHNLQKKRIGLVQNGSWMPNAAKVMKERLSKGKELEFLDQITIYSAITDENKQQLKELAKKLR